VSFFAHFIEYSLGVKVGDKVKFGSSLGLCGNSGNIDYPHIHLHLQDPSIPYKGDGLETESRQINVDLSGKRFLEVQWLSLEK
jgi:murein DD-endopeptidase MepM/ murein hydrolase activator NlpD